MSYSYFVFSPHCPVCGVDGEATITTKVESEPGTAHYAGSVLDVTVADMDCTHHRVRSMRTGEPLRILEEWACSNCGIGQWIEITVDDKRIRSIEIVPFSSETLDRIHYIADGLAEFYEERTHESLYVDNELRSDWLERLRRAI